MHKRKTPIILSILVALVLVVVMGFQVLNKSGDLSQFLFGFFFNKNIELKTANENINILLLGIGGAKHEGPNLTDTIILVNINQKDNKIILNSIPRDLWVPDLSGQNKKINVAYAQGENKKSGGGITLTKAIVKKITGQEVNYVFVMDFTGFVKAVDALGGLDISVDRTFDDYEYPVEGKEADPCGKTEEELKILTEQIATGSAKDLDVFPCRFKHIHFDKGNIHMNGETALEFVRSRHANGEEGTDFARSKRQEKVISAFMNKVISAQTLFNPGRVSVLYSIVSSSIHTDINQNELDDFAKLAQKMKKAKIESSIIDAGDDIKGRPGLLEYGEISKEFNYLSVLIPRTGNGNFEEIKKYINCQITKGNCQISTTANE
jgi:LCP family protein required for cell wall assembly